MDLPMTLTCQYDEDNSSGLNFDEFVDMMEAINNDDGEMDPELMFNMFDANGDGEVTTSEWFDLVQFNRRANV